MVPCDPTLVGAQSLPRTSGIAGNPQERLESRVVHRIFTPNPIQSLLWDASAHTVSSRQRLSGDQDMVWDEETIRNLRDLWTQGLSTAEIGRRLGVSKNAIVGKAHRLDLDARPSPIRRDAAKPATERPTSFPRMAGPTLPPLASAGIQAFTPTALARPTFAETSNAPVAVGPSSDRLPPDVAPSNVQPFRPVATITVRPPPPPPAPVITSSPRVMMPSPPIQARRSAPSCCWPIGEPGTKAFRFCDDTSLPGKPYCDEHAKLAYVRIRDRKEDAA
jgi:GcrA cell cycle regulator